MKEELKYKLEYENAVVVKADPAGVFCANLHSRNGDEVEMKNVRRIWRWAGAASCSQLSSEGVKDAENCMFPTPLEWSMVKNWFEIMPMTKEAVDNINSVKIWKI